MHHVVCNPSAEAIDKQVLEEFDHTQEDIARLIGKSRSHVTNTLRLLKLPEAVKIYLQECKISAGHARALLGQPDPEKMARVIVEQGLNVRAIEAIAQERAAKPARRRPRGEKRSEERRVGKEGRAQDEE